MEKRSVTFFLLYYRNFLKFGHEVLTECENLVANPLYSFLKPIWKIYPKNTESVFCFPDYSFTTFYQYMHLFQGDNE